MSSPENSPEPHEAKSRKQQKAEFALAVAIGASVDLWASANNVPRRTAFRWAAHPKFRARVEKVRQAALDQAIGFLSNRSHWAAEGIADLAKNAASESVRLSACKSIFKTNMDVTEFAQLKDRVQLIEEKLHEHSRAR